jgi:GT2 family glycosyltransferase
VAVIIVNWNSGPLLARCLEALSAQTLRPDRLVVVDNGSDDGSPAAARQHSRVELVEAGRNLGYAGANNLAVRQLDDVEWIALLNPDAFPEPGWLAGLLDAAASHPDHASFASHMVKAEDPGTLDGTGDVYYASGWASRRDHGRPVAQVRRSEVVFASCGAAALYRRSAFLEAGGFDEAFFCYFEDVDLGFRLQLRGHRCRYVPAAVVRHVGSAAKGRHSAFAVYHGHRNLVWTFVKNMPGPLLLCYLPLHLAFTLVAIAWYSLRGMGGTILRAKWDALRGLPRVLRQRRAVQLACVVSAWDLRRSLDTSFLGAYRVRGREGTW